MLAVGFLGRRIDALLIAGEHRCTRWARWSPVVQAQTGKRHRSAHAPSRSSGRRLYRPHPLGTASATAQAETGSISCSGGDIDLQYNPGITFSK